MHLWHLKRGADVGYDEVKEFVIRAPSEETARAIAATQEGDEGYDTWLDKLRSSCFVVSEHGAPAIICRSFRAG